MRAYILVYRVLERLKKLTVWFTVCICGLAEILSPQFTKKRLDQKIFGFAIFGPPTFTCGTWIVSK
jgi:hypothetical protein